MACAMLGCRRPGDAYILMYALSFLVAFWLPDVAVRVAGSERTFHLDSTLVLR